MNKKVRQHPGVVNLSDVRAHKKPSITRLLRDSRKAAQAIATHTCLICSSKKMCVNKTGVCSACYDSMLTREEKMAAQEEAQHKNIKITVTDDRWKD
jgi:hypothetical protein